jgi:nicotinamide-nucleotide amidase
MAQGIRSLSKADIGLSITGVAGPGGTSPDKPAGLVYLGLAAEDFYAAKKIELPPDFSRDEIRFRTANEALNLVRLFLIDARLLSGVAQKV